MALAVTSLGVYVCVADSSATTSNGGDNQGGPGGRKPPEMPIVKALDANGDGVIDATEIANAVAALKKLDTNGDGQLTRDEYMPPHPKGQGGPGGEGKPPAGE